uniref:Ribosome-recycling factor, mitochondrial n=1 Tax=Arion vulgaris TaxID=1028688 RepID=A0A0B6ZY78_9EUPU
MSAPNKPCMFLWNFMKAQRLLYLSRMSFYHQASSQNCCVPQIVEKRVNLFTCGTTSAVLKPSSYILSVCRTYASKGKNKGGKSHKKIVLSQEQLEGLINLEEVKKEFDDVLDDLKDKFIHQLTVRTTQGVFDNLVIKTPDGNFPLIQLGQVIQKSAQLLTINMTPSPQYITHVKAALEQSGLNINPQQDGTSLFIPLPKVTKEHRENMAKNAKSLSEKSKKHLRDVYSKYSKKIKNVKEGHPSDIVSAADDMVQDLMHEMTNKVEEMTTAKQQELMGTK